MMAVLWHENPGIFGRSKCNGISDSTNNMQHDNATSTHSEPEQMRRRLSSPVIAPGRWRSSAQREGARCQVLAPQATLT